MSKAVRRRETGDDTATPDRLRRMLRAVELDYRTNIQNELRRRRYHIGPAELGRLKRRSALRRLRKAAGRQASAQSPMA